MSRSDHSKSRKHDRPAALRINGELFAVPRRWHAAMPEREAIAESLADVTETVAATPAHELVRYTTGAQATVSPFAALAHQRELDRAQALHERCEYELACIRAAACEAECAEAERKARNVAQGVADARRVNKRRVQMIPRDRVLVGGNVHEIMGTTRRTASAVYDLGEAPTPMQMAKARAAALGR